MKRAEDILNRFATPGLIVRRDFIAGQTNGCLLFASDLTDSVTIGRILMALEQSQKEPADAEAVIKSIIFTGEATTQTDIDETVKLIMDGDCAIIMTGVREIVIANTRSWDKRGISEPASEAVTRGPREGFTEDLKTNLSLLLRRLRTPSLAVERLKLGRNSNSNVALVYLANVCAPETVKEVKKRLKKIDIDAIYDSFYLEPFLEERPHSIFKQIGNTERPDIAASKIGEGRVAVVVEGSPVVLTVPFLLIEDFQSAEDHYQRATLSTFLRILRFAALIFAVMLPGFYVALLEFNYDLAPLSFLARLMNAEKGVPWPPLAEMLIVTILFEVIREAAVRMPRIVSMAMSIVAGIVLSETIVQAGIISSPSILIIATSSIALFAAPNHINSTTLIRIVFTLLGGLVGLFGILLGAVYIMHYLAGIDSYGSPYLAPLAPLIPQDQGDAILKRPVFELKNRPKSVRNTNPRRQT